MSASALILIIVVLLLVGGLPSWPYSRSWGYGPSGVLGVVLLILLLWLLLGAARAQEPELKFSTSDLAPHVDISIDLPTPVLSIGEGGKLCGPATVWDRQGKEVLKLSAGNCLPSD